jgi:hypothetical protein
VYFLSQSLYYQTYLVCLLTFLPFAGEPVLTAYIISHTSAARHFLYLWFQAIYKTGQTKICIIWVFRSLDKGELLEEGRETGGLFNYVISKVIILVCGIKGRGCERRFRNYGGKKMSRLSNMCCLVLHRISKCT